jgi:putative salt-induced outer membrane protein
MRVLMLSLIAMPAFAQEAKETENWVSELTVGFNLSDGNTDKSLLSVGASAERKWDENEWLNKAEYVYGESSGDKDTDKGDASSQFNRLLNDGLFSYARVDARFDDIADIDYRMSVGPGLGYYILKDDKASLAVEGGIVYTWEEVGGLDDEYASLRLAKRLEYTVNENVVFFEVAEYLPQVDDMGTYLLNAEVGLDAALNGRLALRVVVQDKYDSDPAEGREKNDVLLTVGLVQKL